MPFAKDRLAMTDGFSQVIPSTAAQLPSIGRSKWYGAPALGTTLGGTANKKTKAKPRLPETRRCLLSSGDQSSTVLWAERLETQANDAFHSEKARRAVLEARHKSHEKSKQPKADTSAGGFVHDYLHRTRRHDFWR
mmetsp:Transcript_101505/g.180372  ORF Transcript_101505/g.180372 Transcript_101505/m.180372 type:complete len:136 (-) Transcript_101505:60-467(-)